MGRLSDKLQEIEPVYTTRSSPVPKKPRGINEFFNWIMTLDDKEYPASGSCIRRLKKEKRPGLFTGFFLLYEEWIRKGCP